MLCLDDQALYHESAASLPAVIARSSASVSAAFALILISACTIVVWRARQLVKADFEKYEAAWTSIQQAPPGYGQALAELCEEVSMIRSTLGTEAGKSPVQRIAVPDDSILPGWVPFTPRSRSDVPLSRIKQCLLSISCGLGVCPAEVCSADRAESLDHRS